MTNVIKNTFTAKVVTPQGERILPNSILYKGKLAQVIKVGVGTPTIKGGINAYGEGETWEEYSSFKDTIKGLYSKHLMGSKANEVKLILDKSNGNLTPENEHLLIEYGFTLGENPGGYNIINLDEQKAQEEKQHEQDILNKIKPIRTKERHFGIYFIDRLPLSVFNLIRPFGKYWSAADIDEWFDDMDDFYRVGTGKQLAGWYFTEQAVEKLKQNGYTIE